MKKIVVKKVKDELVPVPDNIKREFEQVLTSGGLFKIVSKAPTMFGNFHYQILSLKPYEEAEFEKIYKIMSNKIRAFERKYGATDRKHGDIPVTWNFGYQKDKYISAGVDLYQMWVEDSVKDSKVKDSMYYVYLHSPYGTELIGSGSLEQCKKIKEKKDKDWQRGDMWHTEITNKKLEEYSMYDSTNLSSLDKSFIEKIDERLHWNDADSFDGYLHGNESTKIKEIIKKYNIQENEFKSIAPYIYKAYGYKYLLSLNDSINDEEMDYNKFRKALLNAESKAKLKEIKEQIEDFYDKDLINDVEYKKLMRTYDNMIVTPLDACEVKDSNGYVYLFPDEPAMGNYKNDCRKFGLEFVGKNNFNGERNLVIRGSLSNLKRYAESLGYDLHPDYIYKPNEFAGDIEDAYKGPYYSDKDKQDKEFVKSALAEMRRYIRNWDYMSTQDKKFVGCSLAELKARVKELESVQDTCKDGCKDEMVKTPRGEFELVNKTEEELRKEGYGFHHSGNGYKVFTKNNQAVAIKAGDACKDEMVKDGKIFTVFPDDGSNPQDFKTLKEAINYGNKYHQKGFIIESPNDMDLELHYVNGKKVEDSDPYERAEKGLQKELHDEAKYCYVADPDNEKELILKAKKLGCKTEPIGGLLKIIGSSKVLANLLNITEDELIKYIDRPMSAIRKYSDSKVKDSKENKIAKIHRVITIFKKVTSKDSKVKDNKELSSSNIDALNEQIKHYQKKYPNWRFSDIKKIITYYVEITDSKVKNNKELFSSNINALNEQIKYYQNKYPNWRFSEIKKRVKYYVEITESKVKDNTFAWPGKFKNGQKDYVYVLKKYIADINQLKEYCKANNVKLSEKGDKYELYGYEDEIDFIVSNIKLNDSKVKDGIVDEIKLFYERLQNLTYNSSESELYKVLTDAPQILPKLETSLNAIKKQMDIIDKKYQETGNISDKERQVYYTYDTLRNYGSMIGNFFNNTYSSKLFIWNSGRTTGYRFGEDKTTKFVNAAGNIAGKFKNLIRKYY